jgi:hypothetical protein
MAIYQRGQFPRYRFRFAGKQIDESTKTTSNMLARKRRSPGHRDQDPYLGQINFDNRTVKAGRAKSEAGEGRVVPLNVEVYQALVEHRAGYRKRFGEVREVWYVFPWGRPMPSDREFWQVPLW